MAATQKTSGPDTEQKPPPEAPKLGEIKSLTGGPAKLYHVGLTEDAPFDAITVPTCILEGNVRGVAPSVPKRTALTSVDGKGNLVHQEGGRYGTIVKMYPVEVAAFVKYCDTHVFRKTGTYEVPRPDDDPRIQQDGRRSDTHWRADIESIEPGPSAIRTLGEETSIQDERLSKYVWLVPANLDRQGKPIHMGSQQPIEELRAINAFKV